MLDELPCVWNALFAESGDYSFGYNEKLLNTSIANELSNLSSNRDVLNEKSDNRLFSLKRALQLILQSNDPDLTNDALESLFKLREELIGTFTEVSKEQNLEQLLSDSVKLIIVDAFNRKAKENNQEFSCMLSDVSNTKNLNNFLKVTKEIINLVNNINKVNRQIAYTTDKIEEAKKLRRSIDTQLLNFEEFDSNK